MNKAEITDYLIRLDRADVQYLYSQYRFAWRTVRESVDRLPHPFKTDAVVLENLANLEADMRMWEGGA